ncbi:MBL fold metallo-hydrolase [Chryseobacterium sp. G0201]|uniref:MBL fold metallo-hydrolase n=1 Tax=Chryseobacterium sp. G0201 TaxID=2487065 RepID=UPI0013DE32E5|nr:MBL fold metallo-hydrolase [Chryseobacterium sp. G0201]
MWIKTIGKINNILTILGTVSNPVYLVKEGHEYMLVEGGLTRDVEILLTQLKEHVFDLSLIKYWFITHSHYDHCGTVEYIYPYLENVKIYTSINTAENFRNEKYVKKIRQLNSLISDKEISGSANLTEISFVVVYDKQKIETESGLWEIIYTPGHSRCSMSIYNKEKDILFVSDALGEIINKKKWLPLAFDHVGQFIESILTLGRLHAKTIILGHNGILTEVEALSAPANSLLSCKALMEFVSTCKDNFSQDELVDLVCKEYNVMDHSFIPDQVYRKSIELLLSNLKIESFV